MVRALVVCLLLAGCAQTLGERDAMAGMQPRVDQYATQCGRYAIRPSESAYLVGWNAGYGEWNRRVSGSRM